MNLLKRSIAAVLVLGPSLACAATPGYLDGYYIADSKLDETGAGSDSGDGYGLRVMAPIGSGVFVAGEYQTSTIDNFAGSGLDLDIDQIRAGLGYMTEGPVRFGGVAEYVHLKLDAGSGNSISPDGYGLHGRVEFSPVAAPVTLYGQLGYVRVSDHGTADGLEWLIGGVYDFTPMFGAFVDYRATDLKDDSNTHDKLKDLRLGLRWNFGAV